MNKQRNARTIAIMKKITEVDSGDLAHRDPAQPNQSAVLEERRTSKPHEYNLRGDTQRTYGNDDDNEANEDFSPDVSEYLPSPERQNVLRKRSHSSSSTSEDSTLIMPSEDQTKTPSTDSVISFIMHHTDFVASPSIVYYNVNQKLIDTPKTSRSPLSRQAAGYYQNQRTSRRMLEYPSPSTSTSVYANIHCDQEKESNPPSCELSLDKECHVSFTAPVDCIGLDNTLTPMNISNSILTEDTTLLGDDQIITNEQHQNLESSTNLQTRPEENYTVNINNSPFSQLLPQRDPLLTDTDSTNAEESLDIVPTSKKKTRKRIRNDSEQIDQKNKRLKNSGEAYIGCRSKKKFEKKSIKAPCKCQKKCGERFSQEQRENIFKKYYNLADHEKQWQYIANHTIAENVKRITLIRKNNRTQTVKYFFELDKEKVQVCKTFFINTLCISHQIVYTALEKNKSEEPITDKRGHHDNRPHKMCDETEKNVIDHIQLFPTVESHYVRKDSSRLYLCEGLSISKMYRLYTTWFAEGSYECQMASKRQYETVFNTKFNYSFFKPKKDQCSICALYRQADPERQLSLQEKYDQHQRNKERVREIKESEKNTLSSTDTTIAIFDLEKVLSIPQSQVGIFHYKRKYPIYNFTIYDTSRQKGYCYVWHYEIAKRGATEIGSCLWQFLLSENEKGIKNISFYSDGCGGQNKNRFIFALYLLAATKFEMNITHRFFETGHGQSEGDAMHSTIERELKHKVVYTPQQMYAIIMNAKVTGEKYIVKEMEQNRFYDIKELIINRNWVKDEAGHKIMWSKVMEVNVSHENPNILRYKYDFDTDYSQIDTRTQQRSTGRRKRGSQQPTPHTPGTTTEHEWKTAYTERLPLPKALHEDLMSLCKTEAIPHFYHGFYESLTSAETNEADSQEENEEV